MLPLEGLRIVDFTHWLAGPFATSLLGDLGADVIKVERAGRGDDTRWLDRFFPPGLASYFLGLNRNKRSIGLDLADPAGREVAERLVRRADVVVENFRPGVMERFGLGYARLAQGQPGLIYCSVSSFGREGRLRDKVGMDIIVQAAGGTMGLTGEPGRLPVKVGSPIADFTGAFLACWGITLALLARERTGRGQRVDVSLFDGQLALLADAIPGFFATGEPSGPVDGGSPQFCPSRRFTGTDRHFVVGCSTEEAWEGLCAALDRPDWLADPRYADNAARVRHRAALEAELERLFRTRPAAEWLERLGRCNVPCAPVLTLGEALALGRSARRAVVDVERPVAGCITLVACPLLIDGERPGIRRPPPVLDEHGAEVRREVGLGEERLTAEIAEGAERA